MADIELVIKVPEELYEAYKGRPPMLGDAGMDMIARAIANGTPIPKGHGKLVDVNSIPEEDRNITVKGLLYPGTIAFAGSIDLEEYINNLPPVIEADKAGETKEPEEEREI